ncbi:MAG: hypothetical protein ACKOC9_08220, partial [Alphaproteobacteria bacterium]
TCIDEHVALTRGTEAEALLRPIGWMRLYNNQTALNAAIAEAETLKREQGVNYALLDQAGLAAAEPHLLVKRLGANILIFKAHPALQHIEHLKLQIMRVPLAGGMGAGDGANDMRTKGTVGGTLDAEITIFKKRAQPADERRTFGMAGGCGGHGS